MPYVNNQDVRIHYQVEGAGPPLVLHHYQLGSKEDWQDFGYVDVLKRDYQVILMDARGHGASDKPHDPAAYDLSLRVADVTMVLDELGIAKTHYFGYSLGGGVGIGLAKVAPERLHTLILGGYFPYANSEEMQAYREQMASDPEGFLAMVEQFYADYITPALQARLHANDFKAQAVAPDQLSLEDVLPTLRMPCLLFAGQNDPNFSLMQQCAKDIPNASFVSLPECDHFVTFFRSDLVLPHVTTFLAKHRM